MAALENELKQNGKSLELESFLKKYETNTEMKF
jgi:hypothetical protein